MGRGALTFKGDATSRAPRKKISTAKSKNRQFPEKIVATAGLPALIQANSATTATFLTQQSQSQPLPQIVVGRGKITVSGTVVTGYDTRFSTDVQVGDAIIANNEMRVITMRLSDISLNLSSPFSPSILTSKPFSYSYICKPRDVTKESELEQRKVAIEKAADIERHQNAFASVVTTTNTTNTLSADIMNLNNAASTIVYRERTEHGNYRIKHLKVPEGKAIANRSEMLDIRSKKASDKYC